MLKVALDTPLPLIGNLGRHRTHHARLEVLWQVQISEGALTRLREPIRLVPPLRVSALAEVIASLRP